MELKILNSLSLVFILYVLSIVNGNYYEDDDEVVSGGCKEATDHMRSDHESLNVCDIAIRKLVVLKDAFDNVFDNVTQNYFNGGMDDSRSRRTKQKLPPPLFWFLEEIIKSAFEKTNSDFSESTTPSIPPRLSTSSDVEYLEANENLKRIPLASMRVQHGKVQSIPVITYHISDAYTNFNKQRILKLFSVVEMVTCIKFSPSVNYEEANLLVTPHDNMKCESKVLMNATLLMNLGHADCFTGKVLMRVLLDGLGVERDNNFQIWNPLADKQIITEEECLSLNAKYGCLIGSNTTKFIRHCRALQNYH